VNQNDLPRGFGRPARKPRKPAQPRTCADSKVKCRFGDMFAYFPGLDDPELGQGGFVCEDCIQEHGLDCGPDEVQVWEVGSSGWAAPVVCASCKLSIPVIVDGGE